MKKALSRTPVATSRVTIMLVPKATGLTLLLPTLKKLAGWPHSWAKKVENARATAALVVTCACRRVGAEIGEQMDGTSPRRATGDTA